MILDFTNEMDEALASIGVTGLTSAQTMSLAVVFAKVLDKGMGMERRRVLDIVARKAINGAELRAEINRSVR
jgi:hypothetical protein